MRVLNSWIGTGLLIVAASYATAQSISGPTLGFVTDEQGSTIRPLQGILGAAVPGQPVAFSEGITRATISPQQDYALAITAATSQPVILHLDSVDPTPAALPGGRSNPALIAISPTGAAAALYERESRLLQLVSGLPSTPQIAYEFDASALDGDVRDVAVSDDASLALINVGSEHRTLWIVSANGSVLPVGATEPSQMTFVARRPDALIADDATQEVFLLQGLDRNPVRLPGTVMREGGRPFSAVGASTDGRLIFVAQHDSSEISVVDLQTQATTIVPCHCKPTVFFPLKGTSVFRLNGLSNGPITVLDASSTPRTLIIPVDPNLVAGHREQ
jgi:hypothetical protein